MKASTRTGGTHCQAGAWRSRERRAPARHNASSVSLAKRVQHNRRCAQSGKRVLGRAPGSFSSPHQIASVALTHIFGGRSSATPRLWSAHDQDRNMIAPVSRDIPGQITGAPFLQIEIDLDDNQSQRECDFGRSAPSYDRGAWGQRTRGHQIASVALGVAVRDRFSECRPQDRKED